MVIPLVALVAVLAVGAGVAYSLAYVGRPPALAAKAAATDDTPLPDRTLAATDGSPTAEATATTSPIEVEVPDTVGKPVAAAEALLQAAGFQTFTRVADKVTPGVAPNTVVYQSPSAGARLQQGERVVVTYQPGAAASVGRQFVVVIDAGHQHEGDPGLEPYGPGSAKMKTKVAGGATGTTTHIPEYAEALRISLKLRDVLQSRGVKVVMVRTSNDVHISNKQRAIIGNDANADLVVRIHLDSSTDSSQHGISTLYPSGNAWVAPIEPASKRAAGLVEAAVTQSTGAAARPLSPRSDMAGFNWSTRPSIIVECGFMSNPAEDVRCASPAYQDRIAAGIASGVMSFLNGS